MSIIAAFAVPHPPLLIPGVGEDRDPLVIKTERAFEEVAARSAALKPETLVIFSPHATLYYDYFHISGGERARGDFSRFAAKQATYSAEYDQEFVVRLEALLAQLGIPGGTIGEREPALDHGTMLPLHFFGKAAGDEGGAGKGVKVVRIGLSGLDRETHWAFGKAVARVAEELGRKTVIIASGDTSHKLLASGPYGFTPEGPEFDRQLCTVFESGKLEDLLTIDEELSEAAAECGLRSFIMMGGALEGMAHDSELLSYEGPYGVGYAIASFVVNGEYAAGEPLSKESFPVALARQTLESYFENDKKRPAVDTPAIAQLIDRYRDVLDSSQLVDELAQTRAGAFVSLHRNDELRGCIGTIAATRESVIAEIIQNAVSAAVEDPRFEPMQKSELTDLDIKVDVLGAAEPVFDRSTLDEQRYGVIVSLGYRRGLLLPALEGVDTPEEQIAIALYKAGIGAHEPYELERFEVVRYS